MELLIPLLILLSFILEFVNCENLPGKEGRLCKISRRKNERPYEKNVWLNRSSNNSKKEISLVLFSKFNNTLSTHELGGKFNKPLLVLKGVLMHAAINEREGDIVSELLDSGVDLNVCNRNGITPLYRAIEINDATIADQLMSCGGDPNFSVSTLSLLHVAVLRGDVNTVAQLIRLNATVDSYDKGGKTPLYYAIELNRTAIITKLLHCGANINIVTKNGRSLLHLAVLENRINMVESLVKLGIVIDMPDDNGKTPLYHALHRNMTHIKSLLLSNGANINFKGPDGRYLIHIAISDHDFHMIDKIRECLGDFSVADSQGMTPVYNAIQNNDKKLLEHICKYVNINEKAEGLHGFPIHFSISNGSEESFNILLKHGALKDSKNNDGMTPLIQSIFLKKNTIKEILYKTQYFEINSTLDSNYTRPIHVAVMKGYLDVTRTLLDLQANVNVVTKQGKTPLVIAVERDDFQHIDLLLAHDADARYKNLLTGETLLHIAVKQDAYNATQKLLELGLDKEAHVGTVSPLSLAVLANSSELVNLLLLEGKKSTSAVVLGDLLSLAIMNSSLSVIKTLINHDSEIVKKIALIEKAVISDRPPVIQLFIFHGVPLLKRRPSLLHLASKNGCTNVMKELLMYGIQVDELDNEITPLWSAALERRLYAMEVLLENGADINFRIHHPFPSPGEAGISASWTLIHQAAFDNRPDIAELLLDRGMDINQREYRGWTPLHFAAILGHENVTKLLVERGADLDARTRNGISPIDLVRGSHSQTSKLVLKILESATNKNQSV